MAIGRQIHLTIEGRQELTNEAKELQEIKLPELRQIVHDSADAGDIEDNSDWEESKDELARAQQRLDDIEQILATSVPIPEDAGDGIVRVGSTVTVRPADGEEFSWRLVDPIELFVDDDRISIESPVGRALLGLAVGSTARVTIPDGEVTYTIIAVN